MKNKHKVSIAFLVLLAGLAVWYFAFAAREQITFYQTYGYKDGNHWVVPVHLHVWERGLLQRGLERAIADVAREAEPAHTTGDQRCRSSETSTADRRVRRR